MIVEANLLIFIDVFLNGKHFSSFYVSVLFYYSIHQQCESQEEVAFLL